jgi:mycoredoxin
MTENAITVYGTLWCGDCWRVRRFFDRYKVEYQWVDVDRDVNAEKFVLSTNCGMRSVPTLLFPDGTIIVEPTEVDLNRLINKNLQPG